MSIQPQASYTSNSTDRVPILTGMKDYFQWKLEISNYLLLQGCLAIVEGTDVEPHVIDITDRQVRAGSVRPDSHLGSVLSASQRQEWEEWRKRELKAQGAIRSTVDRGILIDIIEMTSAVEMWDFLMETMQLDTLENQAEAEDALRSLKLKENANSDEMDIHYRSFNTLYLEAKGVGVVLSETLRIQLFLKSLPHDFKLMRRMYLKKPSSQQTWAQLY